MAKKHIDNMPNLFWMLVKYDTIRRVLMLNYLRNELIIHRGG